MTDHAKTEDLIRALAASPPPARLDGPRAVGLLLGAALGVFFAVFGPRPDLTAVLPRPEVLAKILLPLALAGPALGLALRAARPGQVLRLWVLAILLGIVLLRRGAALRPGLSGALVGLRW